jgi:hypothetical protein
MGIRKVLLGICAAMALAAPLTIVQAPPAEARPIRICVQWAYTLRLVNIGGVWRYRWVRTCVRYRTIDIPILQLNRLRDIPIPPPPPELRRPGIGR